jgi:hypothetical protein
MPDPVSGTGQARSGIQLYYAVGIILDSGLSALRLVDELKSSRSRPKGFRRNDGKEHFPTFYEFINFLST